MGRKYPSRLEYLCQFERIAFEVKGRDMELSGKRLYWKPDRLETWAKEKDGEPFLVLVYRFAEKNVKCYFIPLQKAKERVVSSTTRGRSVMAPYTEAKLRPYLVFNGELPTIMQEVFIEHRSHKSTKELKRTSEKFAEDITRFILELLGFRVKMLRRKGDGFAYRP